MARRAATLGQAPAEEQPEQPDEHVDFGQEFKSAVDSILKAYPKYIGFII